VAIAEKRRAELEARERERLEAEAKDLTRYRSEFFGRMREILGDREGVQVVGDRFVFPSEVLFAPGSATLGAAGQAQVARVAAVIREISDEIPEDINWILRVDGHTDKTPVSQGSPFADNWELSEARALSVVRYMSQVQGIPPERLAATGFGEYQPVDPGDSPEALARNRRIELKFTER
jgi:chemotaxis protein MotB